ncbi:MAG TPA: dihydropteroate synthase [Terriglobales bacterium]|nr:dihydropteroate synthase [Terriglobales bacterium]
MRYMGIVNLTPDSFSDGGKYPTARDAVAAALALEAAGAEVLDLGPQSTRPGYKEIGPEEELTRLMPVLTALRPLTKAKISVDTYHPEVARAALAAGADILNTVRPSQELYRVAEEFNAGLVITHNEGDVKSEPDIVSRVTDWLIREAAKTTASPIWIDPGLGFGKSRLQNWLLIEGLPKLAATGLPVLVAASRKSFLPHPKDEWTRRVTALAEAAGADMVRVHEI